MAAPRSSSGSDATVSIHGPALVRAAATAFLLFWLGAVVWTTMVRHHGASVIVGCVFLVFGVALGVRILRLGVSSGPDGVLNIRNNVSGRRLTRDEVQEFRIGSNGGTRLGQQGVQALLRDGTTYGIAVCRSPMGLGAERLTRHVAELNAWLGDGD